MEYGILSTNDVRWVAEEEYESDHFTGIRAAREARANSDFTPLLAGYCIYLEPSSQLKPLAIALGATLARARQVRAHERLCPKP